MISLITTVLDEEKTIESFLDSVLAQSISPREILIVDAGSKDGTQSLIKSHRINKKVKLRLIIKKGNRSIGRNKAIGEARGDIIAVTDVGCILDKNWLKNITAPFKDKDIDVASGYYKPKTRSVFEKCLATYTCVMPDKIDEENFLPSSRSVAFKKSSWKRVGGYPKHLNTCEDLVFDKKLKEAGQKFVFAKNAFVYWPQRKNILQAIVQFFKYAIGDGEAAYFRPSTPFLFGRYVVGVVLLVLLLKNKSSSLMMGMLIALSLYIVWSIAKNYRYVNQPQAFVYLPLLQFSSDLAVIAGTTLGFLKSKLRVI